MSSRLRIIDNCLASVSGSNVISISIHISIFSFLWAFQFFLFGIRVNNTASSCTLSWWHSRIDSKNRRAYPPSQRSL
ncbi:hypothetical protein BJ912DRAFT_913755 [Pholiota molesta]|nr:hypothetical protein BJ912DRAFT_913755 [Pholiota molesta]